MNGMITAGEAEQGFQHNWDNDPRTVLLRYEVQDVLGADVEQIDQMDVATARELVKQIVYLMTHMVRDNKGRSATKAETQMLIREDYEELLEKAQITLSLTTIDRYSQEIADRVWKDRYPDMPTLMVLHFQARMQEFDLIMNQVMGSIAAGDLRAVQQWGNLADWDSRILGYRAPEKKRIVIGTEEKPMSDEDKRKMAQAHREMEKYDQDLLAARVADSGAESGELLTREALMAALEADSEAAREGLEVLIGEAQEVIDEQVRANAGTDKAERSAETDDAEDARGDNS